MQTGSSNLPPPFLAEPYPKGYWYQWHHFFYLETKHLSSISSVLQVLYWNIHKFCLSELNYPYEILIQSLWPWARTNGSLSSLVCMLIPFIFLMLTVLAGKLVALQGGLSALVSYFLIPAHISDYCLWTTIQIFKDREVKCAVNWQYWQAGSLYWLQVPAESLKLGRNPNSFRGHTHALIQATLVPS